MNKKKHSKLWLYFTCVVFLTIFAVFILFTLCCLVLYDMGIIESDLRTRHVPLFLFAVGSLLLGSVIAVFVGKLIIRPIQNMCNAFDELSKGNFDVRISEAERVSEIREMARHFNTMAGELSHIETLSNEFMANVSHEFKTPISAVEGYATLLQAPNLSENKREHYIEKIIENSRRLSDLSGNILLLSKLENQALVPDKSEYRLDEQIRRCILTCENKWTAKNLELDIDLPKTVYYGSESLLEQVWLNLLDNAIKHSRENGYISVSMSKSEDGISVCVADNGEGMTLEVQKHIFEKFYQGDSSRKSEGNGLGLALVKRILDLSSADISVDSCPEKGAKFTVILH